MTSHAANGASVAANPSMACFGDKCVHIRRSRFLGDFCWEYEFEEGDQTVTGPLLLGVFHMGGGHFLLSGNVNEDGQDFAIAGSGEHVGDDLVMTLRSAGGGLGLDLSEEQDGSEIINVVGQATFWATLNPSTLDGQTIAFETAAFEEDPADFETGVSYMGPLSFTSVDCE